MRVYQYAKQCGLKTKELLRILDENGIYNKSYQSNITPEEIEKTLIAIQQEEDPIAAIKPVEINSKDFYDVNTELVQIYPQALYYIAISPRGVGKSTNGILLAIKTYIDERCPSVLIRRRDIELNESKFKEIFGEIIALGYINYWTQGKYNSVHTIGMRSYLCKRDEDGKILEKDKQYFMYAIPLAESGNYKGLQMNRAEDNVYVKWIIFDELCPVDNSFLPNESNLFFNLISSIIRHYDKAKIMLFGNTIVTSINPVLDTMNIDIYSFKVGEKRLYKYDSDIDDNINYVAVHFIDKKQYKGVAAKNNKYFNFGNQKLSSITGDSDGDYSIWELDKSYNGIPKKYKPSDVKFTYYWIYNNEVYVANVVKLDKDIFIFNHKSGHKLGDGWLDEDKELIFSHTIYDVRKNWINKISGTKNKKVKKIVEILKSGKVYYQNAWVSLYAKDVFNNL